jgi:prepilin-type processing-associated H-X9-DG protein
MSKRRPRSLKRMPCEFLGGFKGSYNFSFAYADGHARSSHTVGNFIEMLLH